MASLRVGGAERMSVNLIDAMAAQQVPIDLVLANAEGELLSQIPPSVRLLDLKSRRVRSSLAGLVRYLRREKPFGLISRVEHANVVASMATALSASRTRLVVTATSSLLALPDSRTIGPVRAAMRRRTLLPMMRWAYRRADAAVAVSQGIADELCERLRLDERDVRVIRNPVVTKRIGRLAGEKPPHPWFEERRTPVILSVGRLVWQKDHATLLRSFSLLLKRRHARLVVLGEGALRPELERLRHSLQLDDVCEMPGYCANPYAAMARADLLVLSSQSEGSPNVLAEALACGCPVVATNCPSGPREILADGTYGLLPPVGNPQALAAAMDEALTTPWDRDALRSRAAQYSSEASAEQYLDALGYPIQWRGNGDGRAPALAHNDPRGAAA